MSAPKRIVGIPKEVKPGERRVAATPASVRRLKKLGFEVLVAERAGALASLSDESYVEAGATVVPGAEVWEKSDVICKVNPPMVVPGSDDVHETSLTREDQVHISFFPPRDEKLVGLAKKSKASYLSMESVPRLSRAQRMDALSSIGMIAGYRAVVEAAHEFGRMFCPQMTAALNMPPATILVIGAGVAGLSAMTAARGLGGKVRAFDTRAETREQVQSLGAEFLEVDFKEDGEGVGGYAKVMSPEFIEAEMKLFLKQAEDVDIIITTAQVPGSAPPLLIKEECVKALKAGSVVVDMAGSIEHGRGNCELTKPGEKYVTENGVTIIGYLDFPARMAAQSSEVYSSNMVNMLDEMGGNENFKVDLDNNVIGPATVTLNGEHVWVPPDVRKKKAEEEAKAKADGVNAEAVEVKVNGDSAHKTNGIANSGKAAESDSADAAAKPNASSGDSVWDGMSFGTGMKFGFFLLVVAALLGLARSGDVRLVNNFTTFVLSCLVGYMVIWDVAPALHTPLMSVTNAISGIIIVAGMLQVSADNGSPQMILVFVAMFVATVNITGGFFVTQRMLNMFLGEQNSSKGKQLSMVLIGGLITTAFCIVLLFYRLTEGEISCGLNSDCLTTLEQMANLVAAFLFVLSLKGLSEQTTSQNGNLAGIWGVIIAVVAATLTSIADVGQYWSLITLIPGTLLGSLFAWKVKMTQLPVLVALLNGMGGLGACLVSIAHHFAAEVTVVERVELFITTFIGVITFTGSLVAMAKLAAYIRSDPYLIPGRNWLNALLSLACIALMVLYAVLEEAVYLWVMLGVSTILGVHVVLAIGGGDMPVVVCMLNSYSGWATAAAGFLLHSDLLIITGSLVGASGAILSYIMCKAMNRSFMNVMLGGFGAAPKKKSNAVGGESGDIEMGILNSVKPIKGEATEVDVAETAAMIMKARRVIISPGYGMAVARAHFGVAEVTRFLREQKIDVQFAIHPVAGRLPGHMNVLLAEANVPYDIVKEMDAINEDFKKTDVVLVIGANDTVNPAALTDPDSPIAGMPVCEVWHADKVVVMKRSLSKGYANTTNPLFYHENTDMLFGDAKKVTDSLLVELRKAIA